MASEVEKKHAGLDVYARPFIPQVWRDVNLAPANIILSTQAATIPYESYVRRFAGSDFLTSGATLLDHGKGSDQSTVDGVLGPSNKSSHPVNLSTLDSLGNDDVDPGIFLSAKSYQHYWQAALEEEGHALQQECEDHALFRVQIIRSMQDSRPWMFTLHVAGLRESTVRVEIGDTVQLRQIRFNQQGQVISGSIIRDQRGNPITLPHHADDQHDSTVWAIDRRNETLTLRADGLNLRSMQFNVRFTVQIQRLQALRMAVTVSHHALATDGEDNWMRSMLFPDDLDGDYQKMLNRRIIDMDFHDPVLNYEQSRAVSTVVREQYGPVPFIVSGPPGTGKTKCIVEIALQLITHAPTAHLLICAPSDPAADTLVQRLSKTLKPTQLLRVNASSRSFPEVPNTILPYCYVDDGIFTLPALEHLMRCKAVVTTCRDSDILLRARVSNRDLFDLEMNLHAAIHPESVPLKPAALHWTALLMDEAAQATEPEATISLNVVVPPYGTVEEQWPQFIMAGDQHQLGPRTASKSRRIQTSLFERLLDRPFYRNHPLARSQGTGGIVRPLTQDMLPILRPAFSNLIRNYRSHPAILATPSNLFYHDTLEPEATSTDSLLPWHGWKGRRWPVLFHANFAEDAIEQDGGGWYNVPEAQLACQYAQSFVQSGLLQPSEICIMSPFQAQVRVLRHIARTELGMHALNIGPLEAFQGLESRLVILCTTRTRDRFIEQDVARGLGVIFEPKRFNVAVTRAMQGLVVIGNPAVLGKDERWRDFLGFCGRNGLYDGPFEMMDGLGYDEEVGHQSRLERQMVYAEEVGQDEALVLNGVRKLGFVEDEDRRLWRAGVAAEEALQGAQNEVWASD